MALHPNFPESPYAILDPAVRWFPADEALRESSADKLMPPLVPQLRKKVTAGRVRFTAAAPHDLPGNVTVLGGAPGSAGARGALSSALAITFSQE